MADVQAPFSREEQAHLRGRGRKAWKLYRALRERILGLDAGAEFRAHRRIIACIPEGAARQALSVAVQRRELKLYLNVKPEDLDDPDGLAEDASGRGPWGTGDCLVRIADMDALGAAMPLVRQALSAWTAQSSASRSRGADADKPADASVPKEIPEAPEAPDAPEAPGWDAGHGCWLPGGGEEFRRMLEAAAGAGRLGGMDRKQNGRDGEEKA